MSLKVKRFGAKIKQNKITPKLKWEKTGLSKKEASEECRVEHRCLDNVQKDSTGLQAPPSATGEGWQAAGAECENQGLGNAVITEWSWIRRMRLQGKNKETGLGGYDPP